MHIPVFCCRSIFAIHANFLCESSFISKKKKKKEKLLMQPPPFTTRWQHMIEFDATRSEWTEFGSGTLFNSKRPLNSPHRVIYISRDFSGFSSF